MAPNETGRFGGRFFHGAPGKHKESVGSKERLRRQVARTELTATRLEEFSD